ncbi:MAG: ATP-binding protein [Cyclobacteriaceae bacterium]
MAKKLVLLFLLLIVQRLEAQQPLKISHKGYPYLTHFGAADYSGNTQNWDITQDSRGMIYVCNGGGVIMLFDGINWRHIQLLEATPREIVISKRERIYVGSFNDIGRLYVDAVGTMQYESFDHMLPDSLEMARVIETLAADDKVFYVTHKLTYVYDEVEESIALIPTNYATASIVIDEEFYLVQEEKGLTRYKDGKFELVSGGEQFDQMKISSLFEYADGQLGVVSNEQGVFLYQDEKLVNQNVLSAEFLTKNLLYQTLKLSDEYVAFLFFRAGVMIFDRDWKVVQYLDEPSGLNPRSHSMFLDKSKDLWISTNSDIVHAEINSPVTVMDHRMGGTKEYLEDAVFYNDHLYISGADGIFKKKWDKYESPLERDKYSFKKLNEIPDVWKLMPSGDFMLAPATSTFQIFKDDRLIETLTNRARAATFINDKEHAVFSTDNDGLEMVTMELRNRSWREVARITENMPSNSMFIKLENGSEKNTIWGYNRNGVFRMKLSDDLKSLVSYKKYTSENGFPLDYDNRFARIDDTFYFVTSQGLYEYQPEGDTIVKRDFNGHLNAGGLFIFSKDVHDNYWYSPLKGGFLKGVLRTDPETGKFIRDTVSMAQIYEGSGPMNGQDSSYMLIGTDYAGLYLFDQSGKVDPDFHVKPQVIQLDIIQDTDSLVFGGNWVDEKGVVQEESMRTINLPMSLNAVRFNFAIPYFKMNDEIFYQYKLEGFDKNWSKWTRRDEKEYTNIPVGEYKFRLRARNVFYKISDETVFPIYVIPPWYMTSLAYMAYGILFIILMWAIVRLNARRLKKENEKLEYTILERTQEIRYQAEKLQTLDNAKSRFFANISHELRTPLTLIQGPLESVLNGSLGKVNETIKSNLDLSRASTKKLLNLVEEILDLSKLEAGKLELKTEAVRFHDLVKRIFFTYQSSYLAKSIQFQFDYRLDEAAIFRVDIGKLEKILDNLMSNAVKFTEVNGLIKMEVSGEKDNIKIEISDTGIGIGQDELDQIFNRFYQAGKDTKYTGGTGIGLSLAKELATLMNGDLQVKSELGEGTTFTLTIPMEVAVQEDVILSTATNEEEIAYLDEKGTVEADPLNLKTAKILIVEDDDAMRSYIKAQLGSYSLDEAADGLLAIEKLETNSYDLVITDLMMPKLDGLDLVTHLRASESTRNISVIMLTARAADEDIVNALTIGVNDYMIKPFNPEELKARVVNVLTNRMVVVAEEQQPTSANEKRIAEMKEIVKANMKSSSFNVSTLASEVAISERQLSRNIQQITGLTAGNFIREVRLNEARILLENRTYTTISEVAYAVGFEKPGYFSEVYSKRFGKKPSDYLQT